MRPQLTHCLTVPTELYAIMDYGAWRTIIEFDSTPVEMELKERSLILL